MSTAPASDILVKQAKDVLQKAQSAEDLILDHHNTWNDLDAVALDEIVATTGVCRDFVNSLKPEEEAAVEKATGAVSRVEALEDLLRTALKCDDLGRRVVDLRRTLEDFGTRGDGDSIPGAVKKEWDTEITKLFTEYAELLEKTSDKYVDRVEKEVGYQFLLFKRVLHIDFFRYHFPKVHPSGFSASSD
mmetsp:Transcript_27942/g.73732  ORF Transcript_27942/g.73732 Transcript_27942/m.73732 type:complete len:189 (-) Transcript_27942:183-749(-)